MLALLLAPAGLLSSFGLVQPRAVARVAPAMSQPAAAPRLSRRQLLPAVAAWAAASRFAPPARALENSQGKVWTSGRSDPLRPTSKDKADGTKKDPKYLSCLNDCVPQCSSTYGTDTGRPKERSDCFDECQDQCCVTCASPRLRTHCSPQLQPQLSSSSVSSSPAPAQPRLNLISLHTRVLPTLRRYQQCTYIIRK